MERTEGWASRYTHTYTQQRERYWGCWLRATPVTDWPAGKSPASLNLATGEDFSFIVLGSQLILVARKEKRVCIQSGAPYSL